MMKKCYVEWHYTGDQTEGLGEILENMGMQEDVVKGRYYGGDAMVVFKYYAEDAYPRTMSADETNICLFATPEKPEESLADKVFEAIETQFKGVGGSKAHYTGERVFVS